MNTKMQEIFGDSPATLPLTEKSCSLWQSVTARLNKNLPRQGYANTDKNPFCSKDRPKNKDLCSRQFTVSWQHLAK